MSRRHISKETLTSLTGMQASVSINGDEPTEGVVAEAGYGAFAGLFIEFDGGTVIGWNPEDYVVLTISEQ